MNLHLLPLSFLLSGITVAQELPPPPAPENPASLALDSNLFRAGQLANSSGLGALPLKVRLADRDIQMDEQGKIHVTVVGPEQALALSGSFVTAVGGVAEQSEWNRADAWIPADRLVEFTRSLPKGYRVERVLPVHENDEGPAVTNSDSYRNAGASGAGVTVAVVDGGWAAITAAQILGKAPPGATRINYTPDPFEPSSGSRHGTACAETVYDHAPNATYRLYKIDSCTDLLTVVNNAIAAGVDVLSYSASVYNQGWHDNTGCGCLAFNTAAANGILVSSSAGNRANSHWQGNFFANGDAWHDFVSGDETINITVADTKRVPFYLCWNNVADPSANLNLYLYDSTLTNVLASSTNSGSTFESFSWTNNTGSTQTVHLAVSRVSGGSVEFEIFNHGGGTWLQHTVAQSSITSPNNCTQPNVVAVGAVDFNSYGPPDGSPVIASYSSQGPTNSGMLQPDVAAPTNTTTHAYGGSFGGTSCAAPNFAGLAAAFWSADLQLDATAVRWLLLEQADVLRDWGTSGNDNVYGKGGGYVTDYVPNTLWLASSFSNPSNLRKWPFNSFQAAHDMAASGGRLLMISGGSYPGVVITNRALRIATLGAPGVVGN